MKLKIFSPVHIFLLLIAIVGSAEQNPSQARSAGNPYRFSVPDFEALLPFSPEEIRLFKANRVKQVEVKYDRQSTRSVCYLDEAGQVTHTEYFRMEKKKEVSTGKTTFRYNSRGQLILKHAITQEAEHLDSLAYDKVGRVVFYQRSGRYGKKKEWRTHMKLEKVEEVNQEFVLVNRTAAAPVTYRFNDQNQAVYKKTENSVDSLEIQEFAKGEYIRRIWHKKKGMQEFQIGLEEYYQNYRKQKETVYSMYRKKLVINRINYTYGKAGNLLRSQHYQSYKTKVFYTYTESMLPQEELRLTAGKTSLIRYLYYYR